jgi:glycosyltransferase involved in cell wall biosynthesis
MKCAVIFYHKNISELYRPEWIKTCINSIRAQTFKTFDVIELDYGSGDNQYTRGLGKKREYFSQTNNNHIEAMNLLITHAFAKGYDVVFNTNMDDYFHPKRFELELAKIKEGYQLVSSNFQYINEKGAKGSMFNMANLNIQREFNRNHNIIAHPAVAMHRSFWDDDLHYNNLLGYEDLDLWKRAHAKGKKFFILPDYLLYYRIHSKQVTQTHKAK